MATNHTTPGFKIHIPGWQKLNAINGWWTALMKLIQSHQWYFTMNVTLVWSFLIKKDHTNITAGIRLISNQELLAPLGCLTFSQLHCVSPNRSVLSHDGQQRSYIQFSMPVLKYTYSKSFLDQVSVFVPQFSCICHRYGWILSSPDVAQNSTPTVRQNNQQAVYKHLNLYHTRLGTEKFQHTVYEKLIIWTQKDHYNVNVILYQLKQRLSSMSKKYSRFPCFLNM